MSLDFITRFFMVALLLTSSFAFESSCQGDHVTFAYEGIVDAVDGGSDFDDMLGQVFFVQYTFDPNTSDAEPSDNMVGLYPAITAIQACIGPGGETASYHEDTGNVTLTDSADPDISGDIYDVMGLTFGSGTSIGGFKMTHVGLSLFDETASVFDSDMLPILQPNPHDFTNGRLLIEWGDGAGRVSASKFKIVDPLGIPEPSAAFALTCGLFAIYSVRRSRSTHRLAQEQLC